MSDLNIPDVPRTASGKLNLEAYRMQMWTKQHVQDARLQNIERTNTEQDRHIKNNRILGVFSSLAVIALIGVIAYHVGGIKPAGLASGTAILLGLLLKIKSFFI